MSVFSHNSETPMVFLFNSMGTISDEVFEWFVERQAEHQFRTLVNGERERTGFRYEITFHNKADAVEFKLKFL